MDDSRVNASRRSVLKKIGVGAGAMTALPVIGVGTNARAEGAHAQQAATGQASAAIEWKPLFFDEHQNETVVVLTDLIIPATDTPGAKEAQVNRLIDLMLNESEKDEKAAFIEGLAWLDGRSLSRYGKPFIGLSGEQQTAMLDPLSDPANHNPEDQPGVRFFARVKNATIFGYYTSKIGLDQELQYGGDDYHTEFPGACTHPEHLQS